LDTRRVNTPLVAEFGDLCLAQLPNIINLLCLNKEKQTI